MRSHLYRHAGLSLSPRPTELRTPTIPSEEKPTAPSHTRADPAITAIRITLELAGHDLTEILLSRVAQEHGSPYLTVRYNPDDSEDFRRKEKVTAAYARALQDAGWHGALDMGALVLIPGVPPQDTAADSFVAAWSIGVEYAIEAQGAADQARERQLDAGITEALWEVTDAAGRIKQVLTQDPDLS
ncbi:hypothetical protein [Streptomyces yaizuensis]|uniref:Uncharacterized protein n=1 Tax=Streptomyces yaizuensis TaxID=2989713 RepID=A0ABQ5P644_9ACTN|nr:hypothetical protein [Streptomyces sp. YSPA8]GLF98052.1 hypothetical protein SYYSPA8_27165 [Streptomyces sp. YSPA8]